MNVVEAQKFHPMAGHVAIGTEVIFCDGTRGTIRNDMSGWYLDHAGKKIKCGHHGHDVTSAVLAHDNSISGGAQ